MSIEAKNWQKYYNTFKNITILLLKRYHYWCRSTFIDRVLVLVLQYIYKVLLTSLSRK